MRLAEGATTDTQPYTAEGSIPSSNSNSLASSVLQNIFGRNGSAQVGERQESPEITTAIQNSSPSDLVRDVLSRLDERKERAAVELGVAASEVESLPFDLSALESEGIFMNIDCRGFGTLLRQLLKQAKLWYQFVDEYKPIRNTRPPVGRALTSDELDTLFKIARTRSDWTYACTAATLAFFCGMRACEIKGLQWKDIDLENATLHIRRYKTPAGWRSPSLNNVCLSALADLRQSVSDFIPIHPDHYVFPWHGRQQMIDPTKPMTSWRSAWRSILKAAGLQGVRFHDDRHTVVTTLAENGIPDWVIQAQVGHVDPQMMKTYSHIRREALKNAALVLEPIKPKILDETET